MKTLHTTQWEPYTAHKAQGKAYFCYICFCANDIVYVRFEDFGTILYVFELCLSFHELRIIGKCTSHHLFFLRKN